MDLPDSLLLAEDEQFVVRLVRHLVPDEDLLCSRRCGTAVGEIAARQWQATPQVKFERLLREIS